MLRLALKNDKFIQNFGAANEVILKMYNFNKIHSIYVIKGKMKKIRSKKSISYRKMF